MSAKASSLDWALKRECRLLIVGLCVAIALSWAYLLAGAGMSISLEGPTSWTVSYFFVVLVMWWAMMAAMMLPSAAPTMLLFATLNRKLGERGHAAVPSGLFASAYVIVWGGFSVLATLLQLQLDKFALLNPMIASASVPLGGALLLAAGVYQLTPLKHACLRHCRSPIHFFGHRWKKGPRGAFLMGLEHGAFCLGCCWMIMGLLFYAGVMNLLWIIGLALYVLLEKLAPAGHWLGRFAGLALIIWGAVVLAGSLPNGLIE
ncbi:MAG: DUF2182 domain-containing protein [Gammaproteobacteria bacterium]|nr:DUF2182 domain-containing protein [Gammaproteobacteria bacterium]